MDAARRVSRPGAWYRYSLLSSQSITFRARQADAQLPPPMRFQIKGAWRVGLCSASAQSMEARIAFSPSEVSVDMGGEQPLSPEVRGRLLGALATPFFVTLDPAGAARYIHFEHSVDVLVQGLLRSVVAESQVVLPSPASAAWEASEEDSSGLYVARYRLEAPRQVEKRKLRYTHFVVDGGMEPVAAGFQVGVDSHTTLTLAREDLWLESLQGEETMTVDAGPDMVVPGTHTQVELRLLERGSDPSLLGACAERRPALLSLPMASPQLASAQDPKDSYRQVLAGRTLADFIKLLRALPGEEKARGDALQGTLTGLHALFVLDPTTAAQVPGLLRTGLGPDAVSAILGALSSATTPEALHALAHVMADTRLALEVRAEATEAVSRAEAPTQESIASLWRLARGSDAVLRQGAALALGSAAMHLQKADARAADVVVAEMSSALAAAQGEEAQERWLGALGNTGSPPALPSIQAFLTAASPAMRALATEGLRFMPAPQADHLLSERLLSDDAPQVRKAAILAAGFRPLEPLLPAVERALRSDPETVVRRALVHLLEAQASTSPQARRLLTRSSQEDADASVRAEAAKALASHPLP